MDKPDIKKTYFNIKGRYWEKGKNNFSSVNIEDSIFEILDGDIVMSYSDNPATTYYDGVPLDILVRDINALLVKNAS